MFTYKIEFATTKSDVEQRIVELRAEGFEILTEMSNGNVIMGVKGNSTPDKFGNVFEIFLPEFK